MRVLKRNSVNVSARAVAGFGGNQGCVYALSKTGNGGTSPPGGLSVTGSAVISLPGCDLFVDSTDPKAITGTGTASISAKAIGVVGNYSVSGSISPAPKTGMTPVSDPLAYLPQPSIPSGCTTGLTFAGSATGSVGPGCYSKIDLSHAGILTLSAGTYVINGNVSVVGNSTLTGSGVTIFTTGGITVSNSASLNLTAPTSGTYNGILFFQSRTDSAAASFTGNVAPSIQGIFYHPNASMTFTGSSSGNIYAAFVTKSLTLTGGTSLKSYALENADNPLASVTLVE